MTYRDWLKSQRDYYRDRRKGKRLRHNDEILVAAFGRALKEFDRRFELHGRRTGKDDFNWWLERAEEVTQEN